MPMTPDEIIKLLERNGFVWVGGEGSHRKYRNKVTGRQVIIPYHKKDLHIGTEKSILKQAGLK